MRDLSAFGTEQYPVHPSGLRGLIECPWRTVRNFLYPSEDVGGVAGDTGSATHAAAAAFHNGSDVADCLASMRERNAEYPMADLNDAAAMFIKYVSDTRNCGVECALVEAPIAFDIAPHPMDATGAPIRVIGTVDQVRLSPDGKLRAWDIKTSKKDPTELLGFHTFQMAAYCVGASVCLGKTVHPGGLICPRKYGADPSRSPAHWSFAWSFNDVEQVLSPLRATVAAVRRGEVHHFPNTSCVWCAFRSPDLCLPALKKELNG